MTPGEPGLAGVPSPPASVEAQAPVFQGWERERIDSSIGVLTSIGADGSPHAVPVGVRWDEGALRFETASDSVKLRNIERDPRVALLVFGRPKWGVLINGRAEVLSKGTGPEQSQIRIKPQRKVSWRRKEGRV